MNTWRDDKGRFARPISYVVKGAIRDTYYDKAGRVTSFATVATNPKEVYAREVKSVERRRKKAKVEVKGPKITKPRKKVAPKAPRKPAKPAKKPPKAKPLKVKKKPAKKPPKKSEKPKKTPLPRIFGKNRHELLMRAGKEIRERINEANDRVVQELAQGHEAKDRDDATGYEYYQLIAQVEQMSPHDIYTLFKSPEL